ncbi:Ger(x)C family spore germination protein [Paenibacillus sp. P36]|uniref:Ger(x)C family spore germination protein n=1 Tax=Paenibacillus sp. P36 TaxID=3342538 RepID=UPI0038B23776
MKKRLSCVFLLFSVIVLSGCWDQRELKNIRMVHMAGIDLLENGLVKLTVSIPTVKSSLESSAKVVTPKVSAEGHTVLEASNFLQQVVSQHMDLREIRILLVNEKYAKKDLYEGLDFFYREAHFPISVYIAVTDSSAHNIVQLAVEDRSLISEYLYDLLKSGEEDGMIPRESPYLISSTLNKPGKDIVLPYVISSTIKGRARIDGIALFHNKKMTGKLKDEVARTFVMLSPQKSHGMLTEQIGPKDSYVTFSFESKHENMKIDTQNGITVNLYATLLCQLVDNPTGEKLNESRTVEMGRQLERLLTERAKEMVKQLQTANCDGYGIGYRIKATNPHLWETLAWETTYPKIKIEPHITVNVRNRGLLN